MKIYIPVLPFDANVIIAFAILMIGFIVLSFYTRKKIFSFLAGMMSLQIGFAFSDEVILFVTMIGLTMFMIYDTLWGE